MVIELKDNFGVDVKPGDYVMWRGRKKFRFGYVNKMVVFANANGSITTRFTIQPKSNNYFDYPIVVKNFVKMEKPNV